MSRTRSADPRRTKIVATLGPASGDAATIAALVGAGVDVFRLNFSHGDHATHGRLIRLARRASADAGRPVALLADLQGPKIRVGRLAGAAPITLARGSGLVIVARDDLVGGPGRIGCSYPALARDVRAGERLLLDDGNLELEVTRVRGDEVHTRVRVGGLLRQHRGINLPGTRISAPALTRKDLDDLSFALARGVDFVALSFVRAADEVRDLKKRIAAAGSHAGVVAKIERPEAVERIDEIVAASDAIMIARGDMGVELGAELVPGIQKRFIRLAVAHAKPVITATQMLESMIDHARPTRAEASDVANAIYDGTSAVMLSGETAAGAYPVEAVRTMDRIVRRTESELAAKLAADSGVTCLPPTLGTAELGGEAPSIAEATVRAAARAALDARARAVVVLTDHGRTAHLVARERLPMPVVALTPTRGTWRRLALEWGVVPGRVAYARDAKKLLDAAIAAVVAAGHASAGDRVVVVAGRLRESGATDTVGIREVPRRTSRRRTGPSKTSLRT